MKETKNNLIKTTCKDLGLTHAQLGARIGYSASAINNAARQDEISAPLKYAIGLLVENVKLVKELEKCSELKATLAKYVL